MGELRQSANEYWMNHGGTLNYQRKKARGMSEFSAAEISGSGTVAPPTIDNFELKAAKNMTEMRGSEVAGLSAYTTNKKNKESVTGLKYVKEIPFIENVVGGGQITTTMPHKNSRRQIMA